jgi:predicted transcriptional regulator
VGDPDSKSKDTKLVPQPDDEAEVRAGVDEAERGEVLYEQESVAYVRTLLARCAE